MHFANKKACVGYLFDPFWVKLLERRAAPGGMKEETSLFQSNQQTTERKPYLLSPCLSRAYFNSQIRNKRDEIVQLQPFSVEIPGSLWRI